jgi:hypothetical protein
MATPDDDQIKRRRLERKQLTTPLALTNVFTNENVGELINVTIEGLMIMANEPLETQSIFQLQLHLPAPIKGQTHINLGVDCLWCKQDDNFNRYWAGFQIIDASPESIDILAELITQFTDS